MTVSFVITLPRTSVPDDTKHLLRMLVPLAAPVVLGVADASGVGLPARLILGTVLSAAEDALRP